jgi:hypothetical protein
MNNNDPMMKITGSDGMWAIYWHDDHDPDLREFVDLELDELNVFYSDHRSSEIARDYAIESDDDAFPYDLFTFVWQRRPRTPAPRPARGTERRRS